MTETREYLAKYEKQFIKNLKRYPSSKKQIKRYAFFLTVGPHDKAYAMK
jgi:hypothetical protein